MLLVVKPERKRPIGRRRRTWMDNIKMDPGEREDVVVWTGLIWVRLRTSGWLL
jgi:hypothetical protein